MDNAGKNIQEGGGLNLNDQDKYNVNHICEKDNQQISKSVNLDIKDNLSFHEIKQENIKKDVEDWDKLHNVIVLRSDVNLGSALVNSMTKNQNKEEKVENNNLKNETNEIDSLKDSVQIELNKEKKAEKISEEVNKMKDNLNVQSY